MQENTLEKEPVAQTLESNAEPKDKDPIKEKVPTLYERISVVREKSLEENLRTQLGAILSQSTLDLLSNDRERLIKAVLDGITWIETRQNDWYTKIRPDEFYVGASQSCVVSHVYTLPYGLAVTQLKISLDDATNLGLHPGSEVALSDPISRALTVLWLTATKWFSPETPTPTTTA